MYTTLKKSFKGIIKEPYRDEFIDTLEYACQNVNSIIRYTYLFLNSYVVYLFSQQKHNIIIDHDLLRNIYSCVSIMSHNRHLKYINSDVKLFNDLIFSKLKLTLPKRDGMTDMLSYESETIITCINNNIKEHFYTRIKKYLKIMYNSDEKYNNINDSNCTPKEKKITT